MIADCDGLVVVYDSLVPDRHAKLARSLRDVVARLGTPPPDAALAALILREEQACLRGPYVPYPIVMRWTMERAAHALGFELEEDDRDRLLLGMASLAPSGEAVAALRRLRAIRPLALVSDADRTLVEGALPLDLSQALTSGADPAQGALPRDLPIALVTGADVQAYLPLPDALRLSAQRLGRPVGRLLLGSPAQRDLTAGRALGMQTAHLPDLSALTALTEALTEN